MTTSPALALPELPVVAHARQWFIDKETPFKEKRENGRMAVARKFKFHAVTAARLFSDDGELVLKSDALTYGQQCAQAQGEAQAAEIERLREALETITSMCEMHGEFSNGVKDSTGTIDEGNVRAGEIIGAARAALKSEAA